MTSLDTMRRAAKALRRAAQAGDAEAQHRIAAVLGPKTALTHADALHVVAREAGYDSWPKLKHTVETAEMDRAGRAERLKLALFHGQTATIETLLQQDPSLGRANFGLACALYDIDHVRDHIRQDPEVALRQVGGARVPMLHLCASQYWKTGGDPKAMLAVADALRAAGADVNSAMPSEPDSPHMLSALYFALGHAGNLELAAWLLEQGATPDDNESLYHATELGHLDGVRLLLKHGVRIAGTNALARMLDFESVEGVRLLLEAGADPNEGISEHPSGEPPMVIPALHQAARRGRSAEIVELLLAHGADGRTGYRGHTAYAFARLYDNRPVARLLERVDQAVPLDPTEDLLARSAEGPVAGRIDPTSLTDETRKILVGLVGAPHDLARVQRLVGLGIDPDWTDDMGMPAIHVAAWEGFADTVSWLLTLGPDLRRKNSYGGDLMGTVIHGAEFSPARATRDHIGCARAILQAGAPLHRNDIEACGVPALVEVLEEWANSRPDCIVEQQNSA